MALPIFIDIHDIDIYTYPLHKHPSTPTVDDVLTLGDLHGNAVKLLYFLIYMNVVDMDDDQYGLFVYLYNLPVHDLGRGHIVAFNTCINDIRIINPTAIRLIGDVLADRGSNDYFTLKLLDLLCNKHISIEILLSNHDIEFICAYDSSAPKNIPIPPFFMMPDKQLKRIENGKPIMEDCTPYVRSLANFDLLLNSPNNLITHDELVALSTSTNCHYRKLLTLIAYHVDSETNTLSIFTHAPNELSLIRKLADFFHLTYKDNTLFDLTNTIDNINRCFKKYADANTIIELFGIESHPLYLLIGNREYDEDNMVFEQNGYRLKYCHGHHGQGRTPAALRAHVTNLDNYLGYVFPTGFTPQTQDEIAYYLHLSTQLTILVETTKVTLELEEKVVTALTILKHDKTLEPTAQRQSERLKDKNRLFSSRNASQPKDTTNQVSDKKDKGTHHVGKHTRHQQK
jgi:hypothetical protein